MFCTYVIESEKGSELYVGFTTNLKQRVAEHNQGLNTSTKRYKPWRCVYCEYCINEQDARRRERYLKTSEGRRMIRRRLKEYFAEAGRRAS